MVERRQRTDDGACLYYKLTNEPNGSGELKLGIFVLLIITDTYVIFIHS